MFCFFLHFIYYLIANSWTWDGLTQSSWTYRWTIRWYHITSTFSQKRFTLWLHRKFWLYWLIDYGCSHFKYIFIFICIASNWNTIRILAFFLLCRVNAKDLSLKCVYLSSYKGTNDADITYSSWLFGLVEQVFSKIKPWYFFAIVNSGWNSYTHYIQ